MKGFKNVIWFTVTLTLVGTSSAFGQDGASETAKPKKVVKKKVKEANTNGEKKLTPKKVDVKNLEKKYWAPKDKKFKVVQNRTYTKTKKFHLSVMPSLMLNEEYGQGFGVVGALGYYFNDRWGLEAEYHDLQDAVVDLEGFANSSRVTGYYGITGKFMPLYAKMSWLGSKIVYFDLSFGASIGMTNYQPRRIAGTAPNAVTDDLGDEKSSFTFGFEVSQSFYLSKKLLIRVDYKQRYFNEEVFNGTDTSVSLPNPGVPPALIKVEDRLQDSISLNLGLTYIF